MRSALLGLYLHALLIPEKTIVQMMGVYVFAVVVGWALVGVACALWLLPAPVLRGP